MKIALIDNQDSFSFNIVESIRQIGYQVDVLASNNFDLDILADYDKIIFSPGPGLPHDFPIMQQILARYHHSKSILGICLGHQAICDFFGAQLKNLGQVIHGQAKEVWIKKGARIFKNLPDAFNVGLYHSWAVNEASLPDDIKITAKLQDGTIMAVEHLKYDIHAIQFHPESYISEFGLQLFKNFIELS